MRRSFGWACQQARVCVCVFVLCRMKCPCQSPSSPSGPLLINCPSSSCDSDHFNQDSQDTHPCSIPAKRHLSSRVPSCKAALLWVKLGEFLSFNPPSFFFAHSDCYKLSYISTPFTLPSGDNVSLWERGFGTKAGGWKQHDMQCAPPPPCVYTCTSDWLR